MRFLQYICTLPLSGSLLWDLAEITAGENRVQGPLKRRLERFYTRLCRVSGELGQLDLKKAAAAEKKSGQTLEDFVFTQIDFTRYRKISEKEFESCFPEGLTDFDDDFFKKNFALGREEIRTAIKESYQKTEGGYRLTRENSLILSVMRALETSLEAAPLFTAAQVAAELQNLPGAVREKLPSGAQLYPLLVAALDDTFVTHRDGMTTRLFIAPEGNLSATFRPEDKPWTRVLIPAEMLDR